MTAKAKKATKAVTQIQSEQELRPEEGQKVWRLDGMQGRVTRRDDTWVIQWNDGPYSELHLDGNDVWVMGKLIQSANVPAEPMPKLSWKKDDSGFDGWISEKEGSKWYLNAGEATDESGYHWSVCHDGEELDQGDEPTLGLAQVAAEEAFRTIIVDASLLLGELLRELKPYGKG